MTLDTLSDLAFMYERQGNYSLEEKYVAEVLDARRHALGDNALTGDALYGLILVYLSQKKFAQAEPLARQLLDFDQKNQRDSWQRFQAETLLGASLAGQKKYAEAEPLLLRGYDGMLAQKDRIWVPNWYYLDRAHEWIVELYRSWGKPDKVLEWSKK